MNALSVITIFLKRFQCYQDSIMSNHIKKISFNINFITDNSQNFIDLITSDELSELNAVILKENQHNVNVNIETENVKDVSRKLLSLFKLLGILN